MQRGPKLKNPATKKLAEIYKDCVDGTTAPIVQLTEDRPVAPGWLSAGAKEVWVDDLARRLYPLWRLEQESATTRARTLARATATPLSRLISIAEDSLTKLTRLTDWSGWRRWTRLLP